MSFFVKPVDAEHGLTWKPIQAMANMHLALALLAAFMIVVRMRLSMGHRWTAIPAKAAMGACKCLVTLLTLGFFAP